MNSKPFIIWPNLWTALNSLRRVDKDTVLWVDAICINQSDVLEKNHQVARMGEIYKNATLVHVWLGPEGNNSNMAFDFMNTPNKHLDRDDQASLDDITTEALNALSERPYWNRAWIRQEILLGKAVVLHCGNRSTPWDRFTTYFGITEQLYIDIPEYGKYKRFISGIPSLINNRNAIQNGQLPSLLQLLASNTHMQCTDTRDRIFSLLAITSDCVHRQHDMVDYTLHLSILYLGLMYLYKDDVSGSATILQDILGLNCHKLIQPGEEFRSWLRHHYGASASDFVSNIMTILREDSGASRLRESKAELIRQTAGESFFRRSALDMALQLAIQYQVLDHPSLSILGVDSGLRSAYCCSSVGYSHELASAAGQSYYEVLCCVKDTDIGLVFHNPRRIQVLKGILRAPWVANSGREGLRPLFMQMDPGTGPIGLDKSLSLDDYIKAAMAWLNHVSRQAASFDPSLIGKAERLARPSVDILASILTEVSRRHRVCVISCIYLIQNYGYNVGSNILLPKFGGEPTARNAHA